MPCRVLLCAAVLCSSAIATGCAARSSEVAAGTPDERRQQIALLDQRIAAAEAELGLRWASPPPPSRATVTGVPEEADAESPAGGEAGGMAPSPMAPEPMAPPPPAQAPGREEPTADAPMSPSPRAPGDGGGRCVRVCRSVLAICDASRRICRLAEDLEDDWAQGRCEAAVRSCDNAEGRAASSCGDC